MWLVMFRPVLTELQGWGDLARDRHVWTALLERIAVLCAGVYAAHLGYSWVALVVTPIVYLTVLRTSGGQRVSLTRSETIGEPE